VPIRFSLIAAGMLGVAGFGLAAASAPQKPPPVPVVVYKSPT
jgi:hypothetical protein